MKVHQHGKMTARLSSLGSVEQWGHRLVQETISDSEDQRAQPALQETRGKEVAGGRAEKLRQCRGELPGRSCGSKRVGCAMAGRVDTGEEVESAVPQEIDKAAICGSQVALEPPAHLRSLVAVA